MCYCFKAAKAKQNSWMQLQINGFCFAYQLRLFASTCRRGCSCPPKATLNSWIKEAS